MSRLSASGKRKKWAIRYERANTQSYPISLLFHRKLRISHYKKWWLINILHHWDNWWLHDSIDRLPFCNTDIKEILLKWELTIFCLKRSDIIALGSILIQYPHIVHSEERNHHDSQYVRLRKWETKVLTCCLALWEERDVSFFCYENVCVHRWAKWGENEWTHSYPNERNLPKFWNSGRKSRNHEVKQKRVFVVSQSLMKRMYLCI